jgi:hypothetical protein
VGEDVRTTIDSFRCDFDNNLPRQIQSIIKEVMGTLRGKPDSDTITATQTTPPRGGVSTAAGGYHNTKPANPNLQLPYHQATAYGPTLPPGGIAYGGLPETRPPATAINPVMLNTDRVASGDISDSVRDQVTRTLRELGFMPKGRARAYHKPYAEYFDTVPYPRAFWVPDFIKFIETIQILLMNMWVST